MFEGINRPGHVPERTFPFSTKSYTLIWLLSNPFDPEKVQVINELIASRYMSHNRFRRYESRTVKGKLVTQGVGKGESVI